MASAALTDHRARLLELLARRCLRRGDVTLASGEQSDIYIDGKMIQMHPEGAHCIGEVLYRETEHDEFDAIGGLAVGAVPMITSFVMSCYHHEREVEGFFVRDKVKDHGTKKQIEGRVREDDRVVIVDDVVTSGGSIVKAITPVMEAGARVVLVLSIVDRGRGAAELFASRGIPYRCVFTKEDVIGARDSGADR